MPLTYLRLSTTARLSASVLYQREIHHQRSTERPRTCLQIERVVEAHSEAIPKAVLGIAGFRTRRARWGGYLAVLSSKRRPCVSLLTDECRVLSFRHYQGNERYQYERSQLHAVDHLELEFITSQVL